MALFLESCCRLGTAKDMETWLPVGIAIGAALEREDRAKRAEQKAAEDAEKRRLAKEAYESVDRKRSGRIAQKAAEEEERRRLDEEAAAKREAARAAAAAKEDARQRACWRWMLLPPRLRPAEVPEGMNPAHSEAAARSECARRAFAAAAASNPRGDACVGKRLDVYWDDDQTWYRGVVRAHDPEKNTHEVYYPEDEVAETVRLAAVRKRWIPDGWDESEGAPPLDAAAQREQELEQLLGARAADALHHALACTACQRQSCHQWQESPQRVTHSVFPFTC